MPLLGPPEGWPPGTFQLEYMKSSELTDVNMLLLLRRKPMGICVAVVPKSVAVVMV